MWCDDASPAESTESTLPRQPISIGRRDHMLRPTGRVSRETVSRETIATGPWRTHSNARPTTAARHDGGDDRQRYRADERDDGKDDGKDDDRLATSANIATRKVGETSDRT